MCPQLHHKFCCIYTFLPLGEGGKGEGRGGRGEGERGEGEGGGGRGEGGGGREGGEGKRGSGERSSFPDVHTPPAFIIAVLKAGGMRG